MNKKGIYGLILAAAISLAGCSQATTTTELTPQPASEPVNPAPAKTTVTEQDAVNNALKPGAKMPSFALSDIDGKTVRSDELLKKGNLVVVFYRGAWCPFCNLYLQNLQKESAKIREAGGNIVAISVENPDKSSSVATKNELQFTVLIDPRLETARKFGIVYELAKETDEQYKSKGLDVAKNNAMETAELPLGATFIVKKDGEIVYAFLDTDYKKRAEPEVIIENLKKIK